jgi:hypothetical protein
MVEAFPDIALEDIVGIVNRTRQAETAFGLPEAEHLATGETIVRHQLMQLQAINGPSPRLDPETHRNRPTRTSRG